MNTDMLSTTKGFCVNSLAIFLNIISFEAINQFLTIIISFLAIAYWILRLVNERKAMKSNQNNSKKELK